MLPTSFQTTIRRQLTCRRLMVATLVTCMRDTLYSFWLSVSLLLLLLKGALYALIMLWFRTNRYSLWRKTILTRPWNLCKCRLLRTLRASTTMQLFVKSTLTSCVWLCTSNVIAMRLLWFHLLLTTRNKWR